MSADNWGICPKCKARAGIERELLRQRLEEDYGQVPLKEYKQLEEQYNNVPDEYDEYKLREDYEFFLDEDGSFLADYHAQCYTDGCDFKFTFREERQVPL